MTQLDESTVRQYAEAHGRAIVDGDLPHVLADLDASLHPGMGEMAAQLPQPVTAADVVSVEPGGEQAVVHIRYSGAESSRTVRSVWSEIGGRPVIIEAVLV